jgi:hypothetical protein
MKSMKDLIEDKLSSQKHNILSKYIEYYFDGEFTLTDYVIGSFKAPTQIIIFYEYITNGDSFANDSTELNIVDFILFKEMLDRGELE